VITATQRAITKGQTIFLKSLRAPQTVSRLLQPAANNKKLGDGRKTITKGKWKDMPMYQLTLEERKTCPKSCEQWKNCYGNHMPFANRIKHESPSFLPELSDELQSLSGKHPGGYVIRLHVLGDFFSVPYVRFWESQLKLHPSLRIFGYTHRAKTTPIGRSIGRLNDAGAWIRWSDAGGPMSANTDQPGQGPAEGITCPEQTGKTASCMTCGLCWSTPLPIRFIVH
jgi:hypothetical protein